jgi:hypothetical protein
MQFGAFSTSQTNPFWPLVYRFRFDIYEAAAKHRMDLITTGAYVYPDDTALVERMFALIENYGARVVSVLLTCQLDALEERVRSKGRENKLNSVEIARTDRERRDYFTPIPNRASLCIDNTDVPPDEVARGIATHYDLPIILNPT